MCVCMWCSALFRALFWPSPVSITDHTAFTFHAQIYSPTKAKAKTKTNEDGMIHSSLARSISCQAPQPSSSCSDPAAQLFSVH